MFWCFFRQVTAEIKTLLLAAISPRQPVPERNITGLSRGRRQRHTHQLSRRCVQAAGLCINRHKPLMARLIKPGLQPLNRGHKLIIGLLNNRRQNILSRCAASRRGLARLWLICPCWHIAAQAGNQRFKPLFSQKHHQPVLISLRCFQLFNAQRQVNIIFQLNQLARDAGLLSIGDQIFAPFRLFNGFRIAQQAVQITKLVNQFSRCLDADTGHTWHIIC